MLAQPKPANQSRQRSASEIILQVQVFIACVTPEKLWRRRSEP